MPKNDSIMIKIINPDDWSKEICGTKKRIRYLKLTPQIMTDMDFINLSSHAKVLFLLLLIRANAAQQTEFLWKFKDGLGIIREFKGSVREIKGIIRELADNDFIGLQYTPRRPTSISISTSKTTSNPGSLIVASSHTSEVNESSAAKAAAPKGADVFYSDVIEYLNTKLCKAANRGFKSTSLATRKHINARRREGYNLEDFKKVIDTKVEEWTGTEHSKYLRPKTLFSATNFESYLQQDSASDIANHKNYDMVVSDKQFKEFFGEGP